MLFGPVAQLGERTVRIRKVVGSNPVGRTTKNRLFRLKQAVFLTFWAIWIFTRSEKFNKSSTRLQNSTGLSLFEVDIREHVGALGVCLSYDVRVYV